MLLRPALLLAFALPSASAAAQGQPVPLAQLVASVDIPYQRFTLPNGLTVLVHTDRKAPIVGVTTYFRVGSKNEPRGRTGFAHLYEHLFFGGSENIANFDAPLEAAGSTQTNGSTWYDRTNYVETVPTGALPLALFIESDRMGHLLGAVTQDKLDKQRGVVENEKRQGDNQPYGLEQYAIGEGLFPVGHPYRHQTIGSMGDLDAATLTDVRRWFTEHYAPNNAILVLSGDIDMATAQRLVTQYFGDIARGPAVLPVAAGPVTLPAPVRREMTDQVATTKLIRAWSGPGLNNPDAPALGIAMRILGGLSSSRLDNALVRGQQLAVGVSAEVGQYEAVGIVTASMDIKPGTQRALAEPAFDAVIAKFLAQGPTQDELTRAATTAASEEVSALEEVGGFGGKGATLAEGLLYSGDPAHYKAELAAIAALTPAGVRDAARRWLGRPALMLAITPGTRTEDGAKMGGWGDDAPRPAASPDAQIPAPAFAPRVIPAAAPVTELRWPAAQHARLSNGIAVTLAQRGAVPKVLVRVTFDAGIAAEANDTPGSQGFMLAMLNEGTNAAGHPRSATEAREAAERLGASITTGTTLDTSAVTLDALSPNLAPSLALLADVVRAPAFAAPDVARVGQQRLAALTEAEDTPTAMAYRLFAPAIYGPSHPYGRDADGLGDAASIAATTPETLRAVHDRWLRPDLAHITVVGDIDMAHLLPQLEASFGTWRAPPTPPPAKQLDAPVPVPAPRIIFVDHPGAGQSAIVAGRVLPLSGWQPGREALDVANDALGEDFLSRLNSDLREDKGWTYGAGSSVRKAVGPWSFQIATSVETGHTGDAIQHIIADLAAFPATRGITPDELARGTEGAIRSLPATFETNASVLSAIETNARLGRPEGYEATLPRLMRAITGPQVDAAAKADFSAQGLVFVVVGDAKQVLPQLKATGLPLEIAPKQPGA